MTATVCQHCPELLENYQGIWRTVPTVPSRAGAIFCPGTRIQHKPMPKIDVDA